MLNLRVSIFVVPHKILIRAKNFVAESNEYNSCGSAYGVHFACGILLSTPTQTNVDDMHDKHPPWSATSAQME